MTSGVTESCPCCGEPRIGLFCEQCGHSYPGSPAARLATSSWWVVIAPDRDYFETAGEHALQFTFPASSAPRRVELTGDSVRIGRRSTSRAIIPEIDLAGPPVDPGVSRDHARLLAQPDGSWALVDDGSMNGTYLNNDATPIPSGVQIPLADGDCVHLGVWTTITLHGDR